MIQAAHIGVGIVGNEGLQAARSADFSFGKFKHLIPLLFEHGQLSFHRTSLIIKFSFYKNVLLSSIQIMYNVVTGFSGISIYNELSLACYNIFFTGFFIVMFIFDRSLDKKHLLTRPKLYKYCQESHSMRFYTFLSWFLLPLIQGAIILSFTVSFYNGFTFPWGGYGTVDKDYIGHVLYSSVLWTAVLTFITFSNTFNVINVVTLILSLLGYYVYLAVFNNFYYIFDPFGAIMQIPSAKSTFYTFNQSVTDPVHHLGILLNTVTCWMIVFGYRVAKSLFMPNIIEQMRMFGGDSNRAFSIGGGIQPTTPPLDQKQRTRGNSISPTSTPVIKI